jgi:hypothetical protein
MGMRGLFRIQVMGAAGAMLFALEFCERPKINRIGFDRRTEKRR